MYNAKDIQFVGKHDYDKESAEKMASSFSVGIFQWVLGKEMKPSKAVVRVSGSPLNKEKVFECCNKIVKDLDANIWDGRKTVTIK
jgi:hypothetical protein